MWNTKTQSPYIEKKKDYIDFYRSWVNHGRMSYDFMTQLSKWNGMDAILVVVNQFSKLAKMAIIKMIATTFDLIKLLFDM
jgi:hypothetical protein